MDRSLSSLTRSARAQPALAAGPDPLAGYGYMGVGPGLRAQFGARYSGQNMDPRFVGLTPRAEPPVTPTLAAPVVPSMLRALPLPSLDKPASMLPSLAYQPAGLDRSPPPMALAAPRVKSMLPDAGTQAPGAQTALSPQDRDLLIRIMHYEAGGEGPQGVAGAVNVVLNRAKAKWNGGQSVSDILTQPWQFESYMTKRDQIARMDPNSAAYKKTAAMVDQALNGPDITNGSVYFLNPEITQQYVKKGLIKEYPSWAMGQPNTVIGQHAFFSDPNIAVPVGEMMGRAPQDQPSAGEYLTSRAAQPLGPGYQVAEGGPVMTDAGMPRPSDESRAAAFLASGGEAPASNPMSLPVAPRVAQTMIQGLPRPPFVPPTAPPPMPPLPMPSAGPQSGPPVSMGPQPPMMAPPALPSAPARLPAAPDPALFQTPAEPGLDIDKLMADYMHQQKLLALGQGLSQAGYHIASGEPIGAGIAAGGAAATRAMPGMDIGSILQMEKLKRGEAKDAREEALLNSVIGGLPADQQALARLDPGSFVSARARQMFDEKKPIEVNGVLVDPDTYKPLADFRTPEKRRTQYVDGVGLIDSDTGEPIRTYPGAAEVGKTMDERDGQILMTGDPNSPEYAMAYWRQFQQPKLAIAENGQQVPILVSPPPGIRPPGSGAAATGPSAPGGQVIAGAPIEGTGKPPAEAELMAAGYADRMGRAEEIVAPMEKADGSTPVTFWQQQREGIPLVGNYLVSPEYQSYMQAAHDWIRAKLRKESGAVIADEEMAREFMTYFPQPGDTPAVVKQKAAARATAQRAMVQAAGKAIKATKEEPKPAGREIRTMTPGDLYERYGLEPPK